MSTCCLSGGHMRCRRGRGRLDTRTIDDRSRRPQRHIGGPVLCVAIGRQRDVRTGKRSLWLLVRQAARAIRERGRCGRPRVYRANARDGRDARAPSGDGRDARPTMRGSCEDVKERGVSAGACRHVHARVITNNAHLRRDGGGLHVRRHVMTWEVFGRRRGSRQGYRPGRRRHHRSRGRCGVISGGIVLIALPQTLVRPYESRRYSAWGCVCRGAGAGRRPLVL